jgi:osmoprotectant transport system permease protein
MGGIHTAAVLIVGVATIAGLIGAGGLGDLIFRGLQTYNSGLILAGAVPAALIALLFDFILKRIENAAKPGVKKRSSKGLKYTAVAVAAALVISLVTTGFMKGSRQDTIVITGKSFTEQEILVHVYGRLIEDRTNLHMKYQSFISGKAHVFEGMRKGDYDMYVEYTGTGLIKI